MPVLREAGRHVLVDARGEPLARFEQGERAGRVIADWLELVPGVTVERAVPAIMADVRGMIVAGSPELGEALVAAGGRRRRHAHVLSHDLRELPEPPSPPPGLRLRDAGLPMDALVAAYRAAYGPGHPDAAARAGEDTRAELAKIAGGAYGPLLDASGVAVDAAGDVVGGVLITRFDGEPPFGGPWVTELFRDPRHPGAGRALLQRALARAAGLPALGLAVTHGNSAVGLYESVGFRRVLTSLSVEI